ncbi:MAG: CDP-alcohol phosphatidyltransferase [Rhodothalassiaceae bacterium]|nr:MAG: CDP-alcohol phosphatidyltransferase [Rhodothalassiaceae bacterium]
MTASGSPSRDSGPAQAGAAPIRAGGWRKLVPDALGLFRLVAAPVLAWLILDGRPGAAFWLFLAAGLSDAVDGVLARRLGVVDRFGTFLDPLADKAVMAAVYVTGAATGLIPWWLSGLVVARDVLILAVAFGLVFKGRAGQIRPLAISKINTGLQVAYAALALLVAAGGPSPAPALRLAAAGLVAATTLLSGLAYARALMRAGG